MKKTSIVTFAVTLLSLAACTGGKTSDTGAVSNNAKIVIWGPGEEEPVIKAVVDEWNRNNPNDTFSYTFKLVSEADAGTTLAQNPEVKNYPTLFAAADDHLTSLVSVNQIVRPLSSFFTDTIKATDTETSIASATVDGQICAFPISTDNGYFLYYDKRSLSLDQVDTIEEILDYCEQHDKQFLMDIANGFYANSFFMSPDVCGIDSMSWHYEDVGGTKTAIYDIDWDNEAGAAMALKASQTLHPYTADKTFIMGDDKVLTTSATEGTLIACVSGLWNQVTLATAWGKENVGAVKLPTLDGKQLASFSGSKLYCINSYASPEEQRTGLRLAELLTSKEAQLTRYELRTAIPCNKEALKDETFTSNSSEAIAAFNDQNQYSGIQSKCAEGRYWDIGKAIGQAIFDGSNNADNPAWTKTEEWKTYIKSQLDVLRNGTAA